jgi:hypothetical protein
LKGEVMKKTILILLLLCTMELAQGCSAVMASKKQTHKDLSVLRIGGDRDDIVAVLGAPYMTQRFEDGQVKDTYKIVEGAPSEGMKTVEVVGNGVLSLGTLGIWEVVGTPLQLATKQEATLFILYYSKDNKLKAYDAIK